MFALNFVSLAGAMREFLEGKNLSFVLLLPSSITGKSARAGSSMVFFFSPQICHSSQL